MTLPKPRFQKGDLVKFKAKEVRTNRFKHQKGRMFTVTALRWERRWFDMSANDWHHDWLYTVKNWADLDMDTNAWQPSITPVKLPKP